MVEDTDYGMWTGERFNRSMQQINVFFEEIGFSFNEISVIYELRGIVNLSRGSLYDQRDKRTHRFCNTSKLKKSIGGPIKAHQWGEIKMLII
jgi:hypothetical protein